MGATEITVTQDDFWDIIALIRMDSVDDENECLALSVGYLATFDEDSIKTFEDILSQKLWAIDGQAWANGSGECGQLEELFLYARCVAVANGKEAYEAILADPDEMAPGLVFELLLEISERAWLKKTRTEWTHEGAYSLEMRANADNW